MKILVATDGSAASHEAEWFLCRVPFSESVDLTLATSAVVPPQLGAMRREFPSSVRQMVDDYHAQVQQILDDDAARFEGINGTVSTRILSGHPAEALIEFAEQEQIDLIVVGARGKSPSQRFLLGSISQKVAKYAPCSVLVTRPTGLHSESDRPLQILVCHDGSESSRRAVEAVSKISWGTGVEITALTVVSPFLHSEMQTFEKNDAFWEQEKRDAEQSLSWAVEQLKAATPNVGSELREGARPADEIVEAADQLKADIVVVGDRGHSRIERFLIGTTTENVLRHASCSVWVVRDQHRE